MHFGKNASRTKKLTQSENNLAYRVEELEKQHNRDQAMLTIKVSEIS